MPTELTIKQERAQAIYMDCLVKEAAKIQNPVFDPQGRVLVDVILDDNQISKLMTDINYETNDHYPTDREGLKKALGRMVSPKTTVSFDVNNNVALHNQFYKQLEVALNKVINPKQVHDVVTILDQVKIIPKGSIIALQQEFHFHLALVSRVYTKALPRLNSGLMEKAHSETMIKVNELVMDSYAKALKGAINKDGSLNLAQLNKALDKGRKEILPQAHSIMMLHIVKQTGVGLSKDELKKIKGKKYLKHLAEGTTATPNDVLHLDMDQRLATLIAGSENTAHDRVSGDQFAHRQLITQRVNEGGDIKVNKNSRIQIRTPSPVVKTGLKDDKAYAEDAMVKLATITKEYQLKERLVTCEKKPKAFIYNSYTAFNDKGDDFYSANYQTKSAGHIVRGAHLYNKNQLTLNKEESANRVYCFVQNISVNGFGDELGYKTGNDLTTEITLMSELALVHTLYDTASPDQKSTIDQVFKKYEEYLEKDAMDKLFSQSDEGKEAIEKIQEIKNSWKKGSDSSSLNLEISNNILENAKSGLKQLMAHDLHFSHEYSKLFQVLSVFSEEASLGGCKSGNERAQAINGRVAVLDSINNDLRPLTGERKTIADALATLGKVTGDKSVITAAQQLKTVLDKEYNKTGLQSAASIISLVDQGASAKVEAKQGKPGLFTSRNYAEEQSSIMTNLHQSKASKMQAHKDLSKLMQAAWEGHPLSWWDRMKSSPLGTIGAIIGAISILPAIGVAVYNAYDNSQRKKAVEVLIEAQNNKSIINESSKIVLNSLSKIPKAKADNEPNQEPDFQILARHPGLAIAASMQSTQPVLVPARAEMESPSLSCH
jgi:hypothetical protein